MFFLRGIAVSLAVFFLVYCLVSLLVAGGWRSVTRFRSLSARGLANLLFTLRIFPLAAAAVVTLVFVVPSFLWLEPSSTEEEIGVAPLVLGVCCLVLFAIGLYRVAAAQARTSRVISNWLQGARSVDLGAAAPTFQAHHDIPPLMLAGVCRPRLLVSESTVAVLSSDELHIAVQHEIAHMRFRDNLKKLAFRLSPAPGMAKLESAWLEAAELSADDAAVSSVRDALDLAAALIKLSRLVPVEAAPAISMGLVHASGSISTRVARLLAWDENKIRDIRAPRWYAVPPVLATLLCAAAAYGPVLAQTHRITEWLVQ
jgi:Zn-dependent protease with chaperone function